MKNKGLLRKFQDFISSKNLIGKEESVLLAISGGVDSMVMLYLFQQSAINFHVAHCNFSLRGKASDADEKLVENYTSENGIPFHHITFNTKEFAGREKISIQLAARKLRYNWFREIMQKENLQKLATAHHLDDNIETFFINLNRGTGLKGLKGISYKENNIIRPLIGFNKEELYAFAKENHIPFREDKSNEDSKYLRNWFRNDLLPLWEIKNPQFKKIMSNNLEILSRQGTLYQEWLEEKIGNLRIEAKSGKISIQSSTSLPDPGLLLFEIFQEYGFTFSDMEQLAETLKNPNSGKKFESDSHRLFIDRDFVFLKEKTYEKPIEFHIENEKDLAKLPLKLQLASYKKSSLFKISPNEKTFQADADKIRFPLILRKWKKGDHFQPLGMKGIKKVSDFLIDKKIPLAEKDEIYVLVSDGKIIWLIGQRMAESVKIDRRTQEILEIKLEQNDK